MLLPTRLLAAGALALGLLAAVACGPRVYMVQRQLTGTCDGACDYYLACKRSSDDAIRAACVDECNYIFSDEDSLMGFESLECADAVAYVEGPNGRPPGATRAAHTAGTTKASR